MQNIVDSGNTNASDGNTSHELSMQYSKLSRDVRFYPNQLQFLKNISLNFEFEFETRHNQLFNPLKTKRRLLYLKNHFVPRSKHFSSRL